MSTSDPRVYQLRRIPKRRKTRRTIAQTLLNVLFRQAAADLDETPLRHSALVKVLASRLEPVLLQLSSRDAKVGRREVVEHDDVGAGGDRLAGLGESLALDVDAESEACDALGGVDCLGDGPCAKVGGSVAARGDPLRAAAHPWTRCGCP